MEVVPVFTCLAGGAEPESVRWDGVSWEDLGAFGLANTRTTFFICSLRRIWVRGIPTTAHTDLQTGW